MQILQKYYVVIIIWYKQLQFNITSDFMWLPRCLLISHDEKGISPQALFPKTHNPSMIMSKTSDKSRLRDVIQDSLPVLLKVMKSKGKTERQS